MPQGPRRLRVSESEKAVRPRPPNSSGTLGAAAICQRVRAALGASLRPCDAATDRAPPPSRAASESRRVAVRSGASPKLRDDGRERAALQRFFHREQRIDRPRDTHDQEPLGVEPELVEAGAVKRAGFEHAEIGRDPERLLGLLGASAASASANPAAAPRCSGVALSSCRAAHARPPPSAASIVGDAERERARLLGQRFAFRDGAAQTRKLLHVGREHGEVPMFMFVLIDSAKQGESQALRVIIREGG